jgi:Flp pilus assembly pilin Flp
MRNSRGQNMIEYILLVAAVMAVCIFYFSSPKGSIMSQAINASLNGIVNEINNINSEINLSG